MSDLLIVALILMIGYIIGQVIVNEKVREGIKRIGDETKESSLETKDLFEKWMQLGEQYRDRVKAQYDRMSEDGNTLEDDFEFFNRGEKE